MGGQADGALFLTGGRFGTAEDFTMNYRLCTKDDIPLMCRMRKRQLAREGIDTRIDLDEDMYRFFSDKMADGSLVEWFLEENGEIIATAGILFIEFPPSYNNPTGVRGYVTNMYTAPEYRRKRIATSMLSRLMDEARARSVNRICLRASALGKPVYEKFGFTGSEKWMELDL